ncbi:hypothetical protein L3Q82_024068 [Scortum barcoo]|uniref:Uncharacterized protein n=1 Tax=Scortum barcoo TaxID=214431 RepID=A0ACB8WVB5_9TELE|nr:hypothetical protein L3Q82_024068 [Scortum barcoo]
MLGGSISKKDTSRLDKLIRRAGSVVGTKLDSLVTVAESRTLDKLLDIMDNASHPLHTAHRHQQPEEPTLPLTSPSQTPRPPPGSFASNSQPCLPGASACIVSDSQPARSGAAARFASDSQHARSGAAACIASDSQPACPGAAACVSSAPVLRPSGAPVRPPAPRTEQSGQKAMDPADQDQEPGPAQVRAAVTQQGILLGQHEANIRALVEANQALTNQDAGFPSCSIRQRAGLSERMKDELVSRDDPQELNDLITLVLRIDARLQARRREQCLDPVSSPPLQPAQPLRAAS